MNQEQAILQHLRECFSLEESGALRWRERPIHHFAGLLHMRNWNKKYAGTLVDTPHHGYLTCKIRGVHTFCHRVVWVLHHGREIPAGMQIDHIDGDGTNNRPSNLRLATHAQNCWNRKMTRNKWGLKGVVFHKKKKRWIAKIWRDGKQRDIGAFKSPEEAHAAYVAAANAQYGSFARAA